VQTRPTTTRETQEKKSDSYYYNIFFFIVYQIDLYARAVVEHHHPSRPRDRHRRVKYHARFWNIRNDETIDVRLSYVIKLYYRRRPNV